MYLAGNKSNIKEHLVARLSFYSCARKSLGTMDQLWTRSELQRDWFSSSGLFESTLASRCDGDDDVRLWDLPLWEDSSAWEAKYSSAITMSPIRGRKLACSWRHIAVIAIAWCRLRDENRPSSRGSTIWTNFLRSFKNGRDCNENEIVRAQTQYLYH